MTPEREVELFTKLDVLIELTRGLDVRVRAVELELAGINGRIADMPTARDFGHLEGRLEEISRRLPTTIGYTPPKSAAG